MLGTTLRTTLAEARTLLRSTAIARARTKLLRSAALAEARTELLWPASIAKAGTELLRAAAIRAGTSVLPTAIAEAAAVPCAAALRRASAVPRPASRGCGSMEVEPVLVLRTSPLRRVRTKAAVRVRAVREGMSRRRVTEAAAIAAVRVPAEVVRARRTRVMPTGERDAPTVRAASLRTEGVRATRTMPVVPLPGVTRERVARDGMSRV